MARFSISESIEIGNKFTGDYTRWSKSAEFEGKNASEVLKLFDSTYSKLVLPMSSTSTQINTRLILGQINNKYLLNS
jgi:hypothetical protein